jgi:hypothetical protein
MIASRLALFATVVLIGAGASPAGATLPPGNTAQQWNAFAQQAVVPTPAKSQN